MQDFDTDVSIKFDKRELGKISEIHNDIFVKERKYKRLQIEFHEEDRKDSKGKKAKHKHPIKSSPPMTIFLLLKVCIYGIKDNDFFQQSFGLHELVDDSQALVFLSSLTTDVSRCCADCKFPGGCTLFATEELVRKYQQNVVPRGQQCLGINKEVFDIMIKCLDTIEGTVEKHRNDLRKRCEVHLINRERDVIRCIEKEMKVIISEIEKEEENYSNELSKFVGCFWHSEVRMLSYLKDNCELIAQNIRQINRNMKLDAVVLHIHSTHDACDNCRLQLSGAMYNWLYRKMFNNLILGDDSAQSPIIHLVLSWTDKPKTHIDYKKETECSEINLREVATIHDTVEPFSQHTKPFVSIVHLNYPVTDVVDYAVALEEKDK